MEIIFISKIFIVSCLALVNGQSFIPPSGLLDAIRILTGQVSPVGLHVPVKTVAHDLPVSRTKTTVINHGDHEHVVTDTVAPKHPIHHPIGGILPGIGCQNRLGQSCPHADDHCVRERGPHDDPYYDLCHRGDPYRCMCVQGIPYMLATFNGKCVKDQVEHCASFKDFEDRGCVYNEVFIQHRSSEVFGRKGCRRCYCDHGRISCERRRGGRCRRGRGRGRDRRRRWL